MQEGAIQRRPVTRVTGRSSERFEDAVAVERALEIRVDGRALSVTLRTPGHDEELALGFLASEGVVKRAAVGAACITGHFPAPLPACPSICVS